jgi:hypothetical protein
MSSLGTCMTDNQGNPIPQVGGVCNLASMHLDASVIDQPTAEEMYSGSMSNTGQLDWEFYDIDPRPSAGANPASQNDFYGCLYSFAGYDSFSDPVPPPQMKSLPPMPVVEPQIKSGCNCDSDEAPQNHSQQELMVMFGLIALAFYFGTR